ncbi:MULTISPECIES: hypothetical protein [unclassified Streptomyces]|uniref:hypothetical protein n=1 Tax=unclassified Streptomyces TaxID=2593676 RepID=UPI0019293F64|nr:MULTISPECIES: hypothetical protein [unclassified Streptomyces]
MRKATQATDWGAPADSHPTLCERCNRRALVAVQLARTLHHLPECHDQEQDERMAESKPGRRFLRWRT